MGGIVYHSYSFHDVSCNVCRLNERRDWSESKGVVLGREILLCRYFGTGDLADRFGMKSLKIYHAGI
jgi:hypothetical protein